MSKSASITIVILSLILSINFGCTNNTSRSIASVHNPPDIFKLGFLKASKQILKDVKSSKFNSNECSLYLKDLEEQINLISVTKFTEGQIEKDALEIVQTSWLIRSSLHKKLSSFDETCVRQVQANFRQFRFIEDYLMEHITKVEDISPGKQDPKRIYPKRTELEFAKQPVPMKDTSFPYYVFHQVKSSEINKFSAGDLLIARGVSFLSAMIARLGRMGTQFSHVVFVTEEPETKKIKTIESYVGIGVSSYEMDDALKNENARLLWLRPKDAEIAKKASDLIYERVKSGPQIYYDYALDFNDPETMSCAEVAQVAYLMADSQFKIPFYPNEISGAKSLLEHIGINGGTTFEPGDMEIDPRFELLGEFTDLRLTRDSRHKDAIMTKMFEWMDHKNYELHDSFTSKMAGGIIYSARRTFMWPLVKKLLKIDDFSKEIPRKMVRTVALLNQIGDELLAVVQEKDIEFKAKHGWPMTYLELYKTLEDLRVKDEELYRNKKTRKQSKFHKFFRAKI
jgi:hypothetical protein